MKTACLFIALALTSSPQPAPNYHASISPETAAEVQTLVINSEYRQYLDFNGDNVLNIADVVGILKRYQDNTTHGNEITMDGETIQSIIAENYSEEAIYFEVYRVNEQLTRQYEVTADEISTAQLYIEFENFSDVIKVELNPYTETITVIN